MTYGDKYIDPLIIPAFEYTWDYDRLLAYLNEHFFENQLLIELLGPDRALLDAFRSTFMEFGQKGNDPSFFLFHFHQAGGIISFNRSFRASDVEKVIRFIQECIDCLKRHARIVVWHEKTACTGPSNTKSNQDFSDWLQKIKGTCYMESKQQEESGYRKTGSDLSVFPEGAVRNNAFLTWNHVFLLAEDGSVERFLALVQRYSEWISPNSLHDITLLHKPWGLFDYQAISQAYTLLLGMPYGTLFNEDGTIRDITPEYEIIESEFFQDLLQKNKVFTENWPDYTRIEKILAGYES